MTNKLAAYNKSTNHLMKLALTHAVPTMGKFSLSEIVFSLRESFKSQLTFRKVFGEMRRANEAARPATGFCLVSSYYIYDAADGAFKIMNNSIHWWLEHEITGAVFDITFDQFSPCIDYRQKIPETRIGSDHEWTSLLIEKARILGQCAGLE